MGQVQEPHVQDQGQEQGRKLVPQEGEARNLLIILHM